MCGRYLLKEIKKFLKRYPHAINLVVEWLSRFNIAPTQKAPTLAWRGEKLVFDLMSWGLVPSWSKDAKGAAKCINARCETVAEKPSFRSAFKHRRCLVPAQGWYEWTGEPGHKQPWYFSRKENDLVCFAGIWETWTPAHGDPLVSFSLITTEPNEFAAKVHDRMPVILPEEHWDQWIDPTSKPDDLKSLLVPYRGDDLQVWRVTPKMNKAAFEGEECTQNIDAFTLL